MATSRSGPFPVSKGDVLTGVIVQGGDMLRTISTGWVSFARVLGRTFDADGDDWSTPSDFPAPQLRKHSLIVKFGGGPWYQGGKDKTVTVPIGESGEVVLRTNDHDDWLWDNDNFWEVWLDLTRADPPPPSSGPPDPTLRITAIEVVQAIQRAGNQVRLVQGKRTVARVFVDSGLRSGENVGPGPNLWPGVVGSLVVTDATDGTTIATLNAPLNAGGTMTAREAAAINREQWSHSLNFELPLNVLDRSVLDVVATVKGSTPPILGPGGLATRSVRIYLHSHPQRQSLTPVLIRLTYPGIAAPAPSISAFNTAVISGALPCYPVAEDGFVINPPFFWVTSIDVTADVQLAGLLQQMATVKLVSSNPVDGIRCGLLPDGPYRLGIGAQRVWGSWVPTFMTQASYVRSFAHEMGHTFGARHSLCRGDEDWYDARLPGLIDDVGLNVQTRTVIPKLTPDIMSYCIGGEQWCSVQFYQLVDAVVDGGAI
jgi:hypothetical protein